MLSMFWDINWRAIFVSWLLVLAIEGLSAGKCPPIKVRKDTIIRTEESLHNGARMLYRTKVDSSRECYELCCERKSCNIAIMHYKRMKNDIGNTLTSKSCFIFDCRSPNKCTFMNHTGYAVIEMKRKVLKPKVKPTEKAKTLTEEDCPPGAPVAMCESNPCEKATCPTDPSAKCVPNFCGGCNAVFYNSEGKKITCTGPKEKPKMSENVDSGGNEVTSDKKSTDESNVKEEEVEIKPEDTGGKPTDDPDYSSNEKDKDPHAVKQWRTWLDSRESKTTTKTMKPSVVTTKEKEGNGTLSSTSSYAPKPNQPIKVKIEKKYIWSRINLPLWIASMVCILILLAVIVRLKCMGPKKKKKFAVDDGDYLINGMYL